MNTEITPDSPEGSRTIQADTVIAAFGMKPNDGCVEKICNKYPTTSVMGDCVNVTQVSEAVRGGFFAAWSIH